MGKRFSRKIEPYRRFARAENPKATQEYIKGFQDGLNQALPGATKFNFAAAIIALRREFDFGPDECERYILRMEEVLTNELDSDEACEKVFNDVGIRIRFDDPLEMIERI